MSTARRRKQPSSDQPVIPGSAAVFRNIVETAQEGIWIGDSRGITLYANRKMAEMLGYTRDEMIGKIGLEFLEIGRPDWSSTGGSSKEGTSIQHEYKFRRKDGGTIWTLVHASPLFDSDNKYIGNLWMHTDITERKLAEQALGKAKNDLEVKVQERTAELRKTYEELARSQQQLQSLFQNMAEGVILLDIYGELVRMNPAAAQILGLDPAGIENLHCHTSEWKGEVSLADGIVLKGGSFTLEHIAGIKREIFHEEAVLKLPDGTVRRIKGTITPLRLSTDNVSGIIITFVDITSEKLLQEQLTTRLLKAQEEERKRIARELHDDTAQALSIIGLDLDSLISHPDLPWNEAVLRLKRLKSTTDRATMDVRRYSHELHPAVLDNLGLTAALEQLVEETDKRSDLRVKMEVTGEERTLGEDIELALFRIAQESLNNAFKHSLATGAELIIGYFPDRVRLCISDNGKGFDVNAESTAAVKRGSLGLLSMKERANIIGAELMIESGIDRGTRVTVEVRTG